MNMLSLTIQEVATVLQEKPHLLTLAQEKFRLNLSGLLRDVEAFIARYVVLPPGALLPLALWTLGTFLFDSFETFPYVAFVSPEKGCGKTRTTRVLAMLVSKPERAVCASEAALFRLIEARQPTLILDEAEVISGRGERADAVRALLNAGNQSGASVPRVVGKEFEVRFFGVFCPKIVCAIRVLPDTVTDRAIVISMQRKKPGDTIQKFIQRRVRPEAEILQRRIESIATESRKNIEHTYEKLDVDFLSDRDLDNAEPLLAILTAADPSRLGELRRDLEALASGKVGDAQDDSLSLRLLADLREIWPKSERIAFTTHLIEGLKAVTDSPWASDVELNPRKLARILRPYGIVSGTVRTGDATCKGYRWDDVEAAFLRYLGPETSHASQPA